MGATADQEESTVLLSNASSHGLLSSRRAGRRRLLRPERTSGRNHEDTKEIIIVLLGAWSDLQHKPRRCGPRSRFRARTLPALVEMRITGANAACRCAQSGRLDRTRSS